MSRPDLAYQLIMSLEEGNNDAIKAALKDIHPSELADVLSTLDPEQQPKILDMLDNETASEVIFELDPEQREDILESLDEEKIADLVEEMDSDDAADVIGELPETTAQTVLEKMDPEEVKEVEPLLKYPDDTAGGLMQTELVKVGEELSVRDIINWIRLIADEVEDFHNIYVTDDKDKLSGVISLTKIVLAKPGTKARAIMEPVEVTVTPYIDQEDVVDVFQKYDIVSLPVVDARGVLLGRITADDVLDVAEEEAVEDMLQMAGVGVGDHLHPIYTPTFSRVKIRTPWLLLTLFGELFIAFIIIYAFQPTLEKVAILAAFMPAIMATGGNVGIQTTTIVIRSLGMGTIKVKQLVKLIGSEMQVGLALGLICGAVAALLGGLISYNQPEVIKLAIAVFVAMVSATLATSFIGVAAPITLYKLNFDPAAASGPFLTMFNDIFGSVFYLFIAMLIF